MVTQIYGKPDEIESKGDEFERNVNKIKHRGDGIRYIIRYRYFQFDKSLSIDNDIAIVTCQWTMWKKRERKANLRFSSTRSLNSLRSSDDRLPHILSRVAIPRCEDGRLSTVECSLCEPPLSRDADDRLWWLLTSCTDSTGTKSAVDQLIIVRVVTGSESGRSFLALILLIGG